jgi:hypothetical protein
MEFRLKINRKQTKVPGEGQTLLLNAILSKLCHEQNFNSDFKS